MATKQIERLLFAQGGNCFFCRKALPRGEASVEHLIAQTLGGSDNDENCVACCTTLNLLFGRMSLKEKIQVVLNQDREFSCPRTQSPAQAPSPKKATVAPNLTLVQDDSFRIVVEDLIKRGSSRPGKEATLASTVKSILSNQKKNPGSAEAIIKQLIAKQYVVINAGKLVYKLPKKAA